jgi:arginase
MWAHVTASPSKPEDARGAASRPRVDLAEMDVCLIAVPYHAGDESVGSSKGPERLLAAGAEALFTNRDVGVVVERVSRGAPFRDTATSAARVNKNLAARVGDAVAAGRLPIVLSGSCNSCMGVLGGYDHGRSGVVWLDAHADFNTPETTASGFFAGMSMAVITGHCYRDYWGEIGDNTPLAEDAVVMFGVRALSPEAERARLERSAISVVDPKTGTGRAEVARALDELAQRVDEVYLHVDFDAFSPEIAPGVVDEPVAGGLSLADAEQIARATGERFRIRAATLATYTPDVDEDEKTLRLGLRLVELLADYAALRGSQHR